MSPRFWVPVLLGLLARPGNGPSKQPATPEVDKAAAGYTARGVLPDTRPPMVIQGKLDRVQNNPQPPTDWEAFETLLKEETKSVGFISDKKSETTLRRAIERDDGQPLGIDWKRVD